MSDEKKGKVFLISMTVIIVLLFLSQGAYPKYKAGKYEEEQKKIAAEQKKVDAKAEDYIEEYASQLQDKMRLAGVDDLIVTYDDLTDDIFKKYTSSEEVNYTYYYAVSYSSESIDQIYAEDTQDGSYESFIRLMENEQNVMNEGHAPGDHNHDIEYGDQTITVYIGNADRSSAINIKGHQGTEYCLDTSNGQSKLLVGGVTVNIVQEEEETETAESSSNTSTAVGRLGGDSFDTSTSSGNASTRRTDPYDVYDYDDPDDFAEEWAEEFGDGDYDDGYDDAYDYWEDAWY